MNQPPLHERRCEPCEGGVDPLSSTEIESWVRDVPSWTVSEDQKSIERRWNTGNFVKAVEAIQRICELAEDDGHHPDLHLTGYRHLRVVLTTHAIDGLSENDFILAAKVDRVMPES